MSGKTIDELIREAINKNASDIHLVYGKPPIFRIHGILVPCDLPANTDADLKRIVTGMITEKEMIQYNADRELDFSYPGFDNYQFRVNFHFARNHIAATIRIMPNVVSEEIIATIPQAVEKLIKKQKGLIIISGTAGSGKSTTLTYIIDRINTSRKGKIITIEDPIEFVHQSKGCVVIQREVGHDTHSFARALKFSLRQDPDVVVVGEVRDFESISMAITTAETGHLVITTVHAADVVETLNRIIDVYPPGLRDQLCMQLAGNLLAIISQTLVPRSDGKGRALATEVLTADISIRNLIRRGVFNEIRGQLDSDENEDVHTLEMSLIELIKKGQISIDTAQDYTKNPHLLKITEERKMLKSFDPRTDSGEEQQERMQKPIEQRKVFIIDPIEQDRMDMAKRAHDLKYKNIVTFETGEEGMNYIDTEKPDIIIVDTNRAGIRKTDGYETCRLIKANENWKDIIVILITGNLQVDSIDLAKAAGVDDFVIKTRTYDLLAKALNKLDFDEEEEKAKAKRKHGPVRFDDPEQKSERPSASKPPDEPS